MEPIQEKILYRVSVITPNVDVAGQFLSWMFEEHAQDLIDVPGCIECRVYRSSELSFECHYLFESKSALDHYYEKFAPALRQKGVNKFGSGTLSFERSEWEWLGWSV